MTPRQLNLWLTKQLNLAEPVDSPSTITDPKLVAITATKELGLQGLGDGKLYLTATTVTTTQECAAVLIDCLALLPKDEPIPDQGKGGLLTVRQAANRFNISVRTIYRLVERNELEHRRIGSAIRIKVKDLERYLDHQTDSLFRLD